MSSHGAAPRCLLANITCMNTVNSTCPFRTTSWKSLVAVIQRSASNLSSNLSMCRQHIFRCLSESSHCPHLHHVLFDRFDLDLSIRTRPSPALSSVCKPNTSVVVSVCSWVSSNSVVDWIPWLFELFGAKNLNQLRICRIVWHKIQVFRSSHLNSGENHLTHPVALFAKIN